MTSAKRPKAFLLAAGTGRRLAPLTDIEPKCLLPVRGVPLLALWLESLEAAGVREASLNTHWLPHRVNDFLATWDHLRVNVRVTHEPVLLGSAGTIVANRDWAEDASEALILYADNLSDVRLSALLDFHRSHSMGLTIGVFRSDEPERCGIVETDEQQTVIGFVEKPEVPRSNLAAAGMYVADPAILRELGPWDVKKDGPYDLGKHVLPRFIGRMKAFEAPGIVLDIGTFASYLKAQTLRLERDRT